MIYKMVLLTIICPIFLATTCNKVDENCHKEILIINNSESAIYFDPSFRYPDTTIQSNPSSDPGYFKIEGHSSQNDLSRSCIEGVIKSYPEGILMYYIYDAQTLETTPWDTVRANYLVLRRYDLSLQDLDSMNWTIIYP